MASKHLAKARHTAARGLSVARGGLMRGLANPTIGGAVTGAVAQFAGDAAQGRITFLADKWWGEGALLAGASWYLGRKGKTVYAAALAGAAGYSLSQRKKLADGKLILPTFGTPGTHGLQNVSGLQDVMGLQNPNE